MPKTCLCVFFGSFLMAEKKTHKQIPPKIPDNPVKILFTCFFLYVFFRPLNLNLGWGGEAQRLVRGEGVCSSDLLEGA